MHPLIAEAVVTDMIAERRRIAARVRRLLPRRARLLAFRAARGSGRPALARRLRPS
jgi:hypothetical protein